MRHSLLFVSLALAFGAIPVACTSSPSAKETFAEQFCASFAPCCGGANGQPALSTGVCQGSLLPSWSGFDPTATAACLTAMKQAQTEPDFCSTLGSAATPCDAVFASTPTNGPVPAGGACHGSADCASAPGANAVCFQDLGDGGTPGPVCHQILRGKAGDSPCFQEQYAGVTSSEGTGHAATSYTCQDFDGVYCDFATHTCEPFLSLGQACDPNGDDCGPYATCRTQGYSADGGLLQVCVANQQAGARCEPTGNDPNFVPCDFRTTRCRASTQTCETFLPSGSPCGSDDQCEGACKGGHCATRPEANLCDTGEAAFHPASRPPWRAR